MPAFPDQSLVLVRKRGGKDVTLDCAGVLTGWQPVGSSYEYVRVPLTGDRFEPLKYPSGTCQAGPHWVESEDAFWGTLWGWDNAEMQEIGISWGGGAYAMPLFGFDPPAAGASATH
jgi:hypothetical protein